MKTMIQNPTQLSGHAGLLTAMGLSVGLITLVGLMTTTIAAFLG